MIPIMEGYFLGICIEKFDLCHHRSCRNAFQSLCLKITQVKCVNQTKIDVSFIS